MDLIYCVEDDEGIRDLITYAVKSAGFEAEGFESASDFEKRLGERLPSMVLFGYNAARQGRNCHTERHTKQRYD